MTNGNKRTAFVACATFLRLNGHVLLPDPAKGVPMMEALAASGIDEAGMPDWFRATARPFL